MPRCLSCKTKFTPQRFLQKFCGDESCSGAEKEWQQSKLENAKVPKSKTAIPKVSEKRKIENLKYMAQRTVFLGKPENRICPITKQPTTDVHHMRGRVGDLLLDERYWVALSREAHRYIEEHPNWAKENGYSLDRLSNHE